MAASNGPTKVGSVSSKEVLANYAYVCNSEPSPCDEGRGEAFPAFATAPIFEVDMSDSTRVPEGITYLKAPSRDQVSDNKPVEARVAEILKEVKARGDEAVREYSRQFDKADLAVFEVTPAEREEALRELA